MMKNLLLIISNVVEFIDSRYDDSTTTKRIFGEKLKAGMFLSTTFKYCPICQMSRKADKTKAS